MIALLKTKRWIGFTVLVIVVIVAFGLLSRWQWSRAEERRLERIAITTTAVPVPYSAEVDTQWQPVTATGTYDSEQILVRRRPLNAQNGFWVVTNLHTDAGTDVPVVRGWIAATGGPADLVTPPAAPSGTVSIIGRWRPAEGPNDTTGLPPSQVMSLDQPFLQLVSSDPAQSGLTVLPLPEIDDGRNLSYAVQWLLFAAVAIVGWFFFLRREARETHGS